MSMGWANPASYTPFSSALGNDYSSAGGVGPGGFDFGGPMSTTFEGVTDSLSGTPLSASGFKPLTMGGAGGVLGSGMNGFQMANGVISGLGTLANIWGGIQAAKLAKKSFNFNKNLASSQLTNQMKSYNTALADRARSRAVMESQSDATRDAYVHDNSLSAPKITG